MTDQLTPGTFEELREQLRRQPRKWLITGVAGFIGSNLLEALLKLGQPVVGLDNYATGHAKNLTQVQAAVSPEQWRGFRMIEGDIREAETCRRACEGVELILHQAALGSVPRSIERPLESHASNVTGFINMLAAAKQGAADRFVYASSSAVYGDHPALPKVEDQIGRCLSPYAATKYMNEVYAEVFARCYGLEAIGLRYFNVFGPRQDPLGPYAAVIPRWIAAMLAQQPVVINGDGETSRDFCYVANVVQANLLAATVTRRDAVNQNYNVAVHARTSLNELFDLLIKRLIPKYPELRSFKPVYQDFRAGDVRHSEADIGKARRLLGYQPAYRIEQGMDEALDWYCQNLNSGAAR